MSIRGPYDDDGSEEDDESYHDPLRSREWQFYPYPDGDMGDEHLPAPVNWYDERPESPWGIDADLADTEPHEAWMPPGCAEAVYHCERTLHDDPVPGRPYLPFRFLRTETDWLWLWCDIDMEVDQQPGDVHWCMKWGGVVLNVENSDPLKGGESLHSPSFRVPEARMPRPPELIVITVPGEMFTCSLLERGPGWPL